MTPRDRKPTPSLPVGWTWAPTFSHLDDQGRLHPNTSVLYRKGRAPRGLIEQFCGIAEAHDTDRAVVKFVSRWGLLGLCEHGLPAGHGRAPCERAAETTDGYKQFALCLTSLLRIGSEINSGKTGEDLDWEIADSILSAHEFPPWEPATRSLFRTTLASARTYFQILMRRLTEVSRLQPRFCWSANDGAWSIDFDAFYGSNLAAILTIQLMARIGGKAMRKCRECPRWFMPVRRQVYCGTCGIRAAWRHASSRRRQK